MCVGKVSTFWRPHYFERHTFVTWTTTEIHLVWGLKKHANGPIHSHNFTCCPPFWEGFCTKKKSILAMFFQRWFSERFFLNHYHPKRNLVEIGNSLMFLQKTWWRFQLFLSILQKIHPDTWGISSDLTSAHTNFKWVGSTQPPTSKWFWPPNVPVNIAVLWVETTHKRRCCTTSFEQIPTFSSLICMGFSCR